MEIKLENLMEPWTNICIFPDGKIFYGESSHDMIIYNTAREHKEYNTIWEEIKNWQNKLEKDSVKFWGYDGVVLGLDFSIRHNIVRVYGLDGYRKRLLLCDETTNSLTKEQILTLYEIKDGFNISTRCVIERWYNYEVAENEIK